MVLISGVYIQSLGLRGTGLLRDLGITRAKFEGQDPPYRQCIGLLQMIPGSCSECSGFMPFKPQKWLTFAPIPQ